LTVEEASGPPVEIWSDNLSVVNVFIAMDTQWRVGMSGKTGLDYNALPIVMRMIGVPHKNWTQVFGDLRTMEDAALATMRKK
jgi:hypothetical protein